MADSPVMGSILQQGQALVHSRALVQDGGHGGGGGQGGRGGGGAKLTPPSSSPMVRASMARSQSMLSVRSNAVRVSSRAPTWSGPTAWS